MRKLWNRPASAVWSLVTTDSDGVANMNICTYVTSVSMEPKQMMVAVYHNTKTLANIEANQEQVVALQLLSEELAPVVRICGQQSGFASNKINRLTKRYQLAYEHDLPYFTAACGYLLLRITSLTYTTGDHVLMVGDVIKHKNLRDAPILTTEYLKAQRIIR